MSPRKARPRDAAGVKVVAGRVMPTGGYTDRRQLISLVAIVEKKIDKAEVRQARREGCLWPEFGGDAA